MTIALAAALCSACSSYLSKTSSATGDEGIPYFMPKRPILVQAVIDKDGNATPSVVQAPAVPDYSHAFVLQYRTNYIADNSIKIGVGPTGLLQSSGSTATSGVDDIAKNVAAAAGSFHFLATPNGSGQPAAVCKPSQTYVHILWPETQTTDAICGYSVTVAPLPGAVLATAAAPGKSPEAKGSSGIFFKTEIQYTVTVTKDGNESMQFLATSPDQAPINFLPIPETFFATNTATITLKDGVVSEFDQDNTGELVGLTKLPADMISAYFTAIGNMFTNRSTVDKNSDSQAVADAQRRLCAAAVAQNPVTGTADQQAAAYANIKAACGAN